MSPESARLLLREAGLELARLRRVRGAYRTTWRRIATARARLALAAALLAGSLGETAAAEIPLFQHGFVFPDHITGEFVHAPALADIDGDGDLDAFVAGSSGNTHFFANTGSGLQPRFAAPATRPFGLADAGSMASAGFTDIDGDGDLDAFVGEQQGTLLLFRNTGTSTAPAFSPRLINPFGLADVGAYSAPAAADLDGDGDVDLAVGTFAGDVIYFRNTGATSAAAFAPPLTNPFGLADLGARSKPAFADLDGDGDLDAFVGVAGSGAGLFLFENTGSAGSPSFAPPTAQPFGLGQDEGFGGAAFGDVDQDGDLDALVASGDSTFGFANTGTANAPAFAIAGDPFGLSLPLTIGSLQGNGPAFGDIDADGDDDAFVGTFSERVVFSRNTGSASMPAFARDGANPWGLAGSDPTLADVDADGDPDAFVGTPSGDTVFFENTGSAGAPDFGAALTNPFGLASVGWYAAPELADIDGDGDLDALVGHVFGDMFFFQNTGTAAAPAFAAALLDPFGLTNVGVRASPSLADVDGDGDLDALVGEATGSLLFFQNVGSASAPAFAAPLANPFGLFDVGGSAAPDFFDSDGDGDLDLFVGSAGYDTVHLVNTGSASAPAFLSVGSVVSDGGSHVVPALADIDGDGDFDALLGRSSDPAVLLVRNFGTPSTPRLVAADEPNPFGLYSGQAQLADSDGDGDLDVWLGGHDGITRFFANTGSASVPAFAPAANNPFGLTSVGARATTTLADIDADGDLDAWIGDVAGNTRFFLNTGSVGAPAFASPATNPFGLADVGNEASPAFGDIDADGDLDALIGNFDGNTLVFVNTGSASVPAFAAPSTNAFGLADVGRYASPACADIDGDGDLDVFVGEMRGRVFFFETVSIELAPCEDGLDNDGDGRIDLGLDAGCANATDTSELSALQCDNGLDDDADGKIDWRGDGTGDPHCTGLLDGTELPPPAGPGCGIGPELLLLGPLLAARRRRSDVTDG